MDRLREFSKKFKNFKEAADAFATSDSLAQSDLGLFLGDDVTSLEDMKKRIEEVHEDYDEFDRDSYNPTNYPNVDENGFTYTTYSGINSATLQAIRENGEIVGYEATYAVISGTPLEYSSSWNAFKKAGFELYKPEIDMKYEEFMAQKKFEDGLIEDIREYRTIPGVEFYVSYEKEDKFDYIISHCVNNELDTIKTLLKNRPEIYDEVVEVAKEKLEKIKKMEVPTNYDFNESLYKDSNFYVDAKQKAIESLEQIINREIVLEEPNPEYQEFLSLDMSEEEAIKRDIIESPKAIEEIKKIVSSCKNIGEIRNKLYRGDIPNLHRLLYCDGVPSDELIEIAKAFDYDTVCAFEGIINHENHVHTNDYNDDIKVAREEFLRRLGEVKREKTFFVCPSNDLETQTIIKLLQENGVDFAITDQKKKEGTFSASWEKIEDEVKSKIEQAKAEGKEIFGVNLVGDSKGARDIYDIRGCTDYDEDGEEYTYTHPAITGVGEAIGVYELDREMSLIDSWIAGYDEFERFTEEKLGMTPGETDELWDNIAMRNRKALGITLEEEAEAQEAVEALGDLSEGRDLITIDLSHSEISAVADRLIGKYDNLLVTSANGVTYYASLEESSEAIIKLLNEKFSKEDENGKSTNCNYDIANGCGVWRFEGTPEEQEKIKKIVTEEIEIKNRQQEDPDEPEI